MNTFKKYFRWFDQCTGAQLALIFVWASVAVFLVSFNDWKCPVGAILYFALAAYIFYKICKWKVVPVLILCASLLCAQAQVTNQAPADPTQQGNPNDPKFVGVVCGVLVIVAAGYMAYRLACFCKQHFPPPPTPPTTNSIPPLTNSIPTNQITSYFVPVTNAPTLGDSICTLMVHIGPNNAATLSTPKYWTDQSTNALDFAGWCQIVETDFGINPLFPPAVPANLQVGCSAGVLSITEPGQASRMLILERSSDLQHWTAVATNVYSVRFTDVAMEDYDAPATVAFYHIR